MASILFQQDSYKRGTVLGLTMAEIVLLILFTLLLVLAALLSSKEQAEEKLSTQIALVNKEFPELMNDQFSNPTKFFEKFFHELTIAKRQAMEADRLEKQVQKLTEEKIALQAALPKIARSSGLPSAQTHVWPPIISLSEAGGYYFEVGSAELSDAFKVALRSKVIPRIIQIADEYSDVDIIEVVGHTDEQIIRKRYSNLDTNLLDVLSSGEVSSLTPADNAGLGMSRAAAVVNFLIQDRRLNQRFLRILPMSGAQVIQVDETLSHGSVGDVRERRRIEIRLRKYEKSRTETIAP